MKNHSNSNLSPSNSDGHIWGYIRVSTREQNEARQVVALREFGITDDHIFMDIYASKHLNKYALFY